MVGPWRHSYPAGALNALGLCVSCCEGCAWRPQMCSTRVNGRPAAPEVQAGKQRCAGLLAPGTWELAERCEVAGGRVSWRVSVQGSRANYSGSNCSGVAGVLPMLRLTEVILE